jgi:MGT family glycosyltransferase
MPQEYNHSVLQNLDKGARILFACFGADGHFNPLTGMAVHLKEQGYDVRWYTSPAYQGKIESFGIPFYPLKQATDFSNADPDTVLPDRKQHKSQIAKLNFDITHVFVKQGPKFYADLKEIYHSFPFDLLVADVAFTGIPFVADLMQIPVIGVGIVPITKTSKDLPPAGIGMLPDYSLPGRIKQSLMRFVAKNILFAKSNKVMKSEFGQYGIKAEADNIFDLLPAKCSLVLQTGTPGFEYKRRDLTANYKFVGPLLPYSTSKQSLPWNNSKLLKFRKVVLVTQGTVEKDETKLLVPTLEALRNTDYLVVVTTGGAKTEALRKQFDAPNVIIEDYIPFSDIMPHADVYITNGGMGGVQQSIQYKLPMVTAGVHEGKIEICARVGYFNLGVNLKTERPSPKQIREAVDEVANNPHYRKNATALSEEFSRYEPMQLTQRYVEQLLPKTTVIVKKEAASIY